MKRRDILTAIVLGAAAAYSKEANACSPNSGRPKTAYIPQDFLKAVAQRRIADAERLLDPKAELAVMTPEGLKAYVGRRNVIGVLTNLIITQNYLPAGDTKQKAIGGMWDFRQEWMYTDLWKNGKVQRDNPCGTPEADGYNMWVAGQPIRSIMLLKSNSSYVIDPYPNGIHGEF